MHTFWQGSRLRFHLQDFLAVVVGYGMAAILCRAFWPASRPSPALGVSGIGVYLWLGLAMSGPVILLRRGAPAIDSATTEHHLSLAHSHTWAERAWMLIGIYWIVVSLVVIPARLSDFKLGDMILFGLVPLAVAARNASSRTQTARTFRRGTCLDPRRRRHTPFDLAHRLALFDCLGQDVAVSHAALAAPNARIWG